MRLRSAILVAFVLLGTLILVPLAAEGQAGKVWRVGYLSMNPPERASQVLSVIEAGLRELGYVPGKDVIIESRLANGQRERLPDLARQPVDSHVDLILAQVNPDIAAAKQATTTIPIVMIVGVNPVDSGFVASLARPGGNITGLAVDTTLRGEALNDAREIPALARPGKKAPRPLTQALLKAARTVPELVVDPATGDELVPIADNDPDVPDRPDMDIPSQ